MSIIKTTIATAAVITCCLGNEMPATADISTNEARAFHAGKDFGYALGLVAQSCVNYAAGDISRKQLVFFFDIASTLNNTNQAMRDAIVDNMRRMSKKSSTGWEYKRCLPVLISVMGNGTKQPSAYRTADDWR